MTSNTVPALIRVTTEFDWPGLVRTVSRAPLCVATRTLSPTVMAANCPASFPCIAVEVGARAVAVSTGAVTEDAAGIGVAAVHTGDGVAIGPN